MTLKRHLNLSWVIMAMLFLGCNNAVKPAPILDRSLVEGRWELIQATRNGAPTETLKDAYFIFTGDSILATNILGDPLEQSISWRDSLIQSKESMNFKIQSLKADSLQLSFTIQQFDFHLVLVKMPSNDSEMENVPSSEK